MDEGLRSELSKQGVFTTTLGEIYNWGRKNSVWPLQFGLACCAIEMIATTMARYDLARFGAEVFRPSPRQADANASRHRRRRRRGGREGARIGSRRLPLAPPRPQELPRPQLRYPAVA